MINFFGPKKLRTKLFKKNYLPGDKRLCPNFSSITECQKPTGTIYESPRGVLTISVEVIMMIFVGPKRLLKTQVFGKKGKISSEKKIGLFVSRIIEYDKGQGKNLITSTRSFDKNCASYMITFFT